MTTEHPDPSRWWYHRRLMAYACLAALLVTLVAAIAGKVPKASAPLVEGICWILGFIVAAYYTNNAVEAFARVRK